MSERKRAFFVVVLLIVAIDLVAYLPFPGVRKLLAAIAPVVLIGGLLAIRRRRGGGDGAD